MDSGNFILASCILSLVLVVSVVIDACSQVVPGSPGAQYNREIPKKTRSQIGPASYELNPETDQIRSDRIHWI